MGVNTNPLTTPHETTFTIVPTFAYFEFLPLNNQPTDQQANEASQLVGIGDVEVGKVYEVVITTYGGKIWIMISTLFPMQRIGINKLTMVMYAVSRFVSISVR